MFMGTIGATKSPWPPEGRCPTIANVRNPDSPAVARVLESLLASVEQDGGLGAYRGSRAEGVATYLEAFIRREQVPVGTHLGTKPGLAATFDVAPSTLNEAMQILTSRERIKLRQGPNGGAFVAAPRPVLRLAGSLVQLTDGAQDVADATEVRDALEPAVTLNALTHRRRDDLKILQDKLAEAEQADNSTALYLAILSFHAAIAETCQNELLKIVYLAALETVRSRTRSFTVIQRPGDETSAEKLRRRRLGVHRAILTAIETQDERALRRAITAHAEYRRPK